MINHSSWNHQIVTITEVNIAQGAGQYRTLGRAVGLTQLSRIAEKLSRSYSRMTASGAAAELKEVARLLSGKSEPVNEQPVAIVVSSVAGGSGAGIFLDISEALKSINPEFAKTTHTFLYGPDVFTSVPADLRDQIPANVLGSIVDFLKVSISFFICLMTHRCRFSIFSTIAELYSS